MQGNRTNENRLFSTAIDMLVKNILFQTMFPDIEDAEINSRLVGYCSDQVKTKNNIEVNIR
jgi:hypothetical protein